MNSNDINEYKIMRAEEIGGLIGKYFAEIVLVLAISYILTVIFPNFGFKKFFALSVIPIFATRLVAIEYDMYRRDNPPLVKEEKES